MAGAEIVANVYRYGGGTSGNVGIGKINAPVGLEGVEAINERPAFGGRDEQSIEQLQLKEEASAILRSRNRAVMAEDFAALAAKAGGVAKATALPLAHPDFPETEAPGTVTVVIVPESDEDAPSLLPI